MRIMRNCLFVIASIIAFLSFYSCENDENEFKVDLSGIEKVDVEIKAYDRAMFPLAKDSFAAKLPEYQDDYSVFLQGDLQNKAAVYSLKQFFTDPYLIEIYEASLKDYPELSGLEKSLSKSFTYLKYYIPDLIPNEVYTYISGLDLKHPVKFTSEKELIIALDVYLDSADKIYKASQIPQYKINWMKKESITNDIMQEIAEHIMPAEKSSPDLLDKMIHSGKKLYFSRCMNPDMELADILKYTYTQYDWIKENEENVWGMMLENSFLFETKKQLILKFTNDGPFTTSLNKKSPPRIADYFGFHIIESFMDETDYSMEEMLMETDSQKILQLSNYKP